MRLASVTKIRWRSIWCVANAYADAYANAYAILVADSVVAVAFAADIKIFLPLPMLCSIGVSTTETKILVRRVGSFQIRTFNCLRSAYVAKFRPAATSQDEGRMLRLLFEGRQLL